MSTEVFPFDLPGIIQPFERPVRYSTGVLEAASGQEYRALWMNRPRTGWRLNVEVLRATADTEWQEFVSFYQRHAGRFDSFLLQDPEDYTIDAADPMKFGEGDGAETTFQLQRTLSPLAIYRSRVLFSYTPGDSLTAMGAVFARAGSATYVDKYGVVRTALSGVVRDAHYVSGERTLLLETARTNLVLYSQEMDNVAWSNSSTTVTPNATIAPDGTLTADLLVAALTGSNIRQNIAFTGSDGTRTFFVFAKQYTATAFQLEIRGASGAVSRHSVRYTWTDGVPVGVTVGGAGTIFPPIPLVDGWYLCEIAAAGVVISETNSVMILPDLGSGTDGTYFWGAQAESASQVPSSYIPTTTASASRLADSLYFDVPGVNPPRPLSLYLAGFNQDGVAGQPASRKYLHIGSSTSGSDPRMGIQVNTSGRLNAYYDDGTTPQFPTTTPVLLRGDFIEALGTLDASWQVDATISVNGGAQDSPAALASGPSSAWADDRINLGPTISDGGAFAYTGVGLLQGVESLTEAMEVFAEDAPAPAYWPNFSSGYEPCVALNGLPVIYADGVELIGGIDYTVDVDTGIVTFTTAPADGVVLSWSGSFYKRARFDTDALSTERILRGLWESKTVPLVEVI